MLALTTFLGAASQGENVEFPLWPEDVAAASALLDGFKRPLFGLHPSARDATRRWSLRRFTEAGMQLWHQYGGTVVILGEAEECAVMERVAEQISSGK